MAEEAPGLNVSIGVTEKKLTAQLARVEAKFLSVTKKMEGDFTKTHARMGKSAQESGDVMSRELDKLRARYDPLYAASKRYETELEALNRAHKTGAINTQIHEKALEQLNLDYARGSVGAAKMAGGLAASFAGARSQIQNVAYQVGDFAVQVGSGQRASVALGQQLPQLLGAFGALGAVLGAVVAIGVPLAAHFIAQGAASVDLTKSIDELEKAVSAYANSADDARLSTDELKDKYGSAASAARDFLAALSDLDKAGALTQLSANLDAIVAKFGSFNITDLGQGADTTAYEAALQSLRNELELTGIQAVEVADGLKKLGEAETLDQQVTAANNLLIILERALGPVQQMPVAAQELYRQIARVGDAAATMTGEIDKSHSALYNLLAVLNSTIPSMNTLSGAAANVAAHLGDAYANALNLAREWAVATAPGAALRGMDDERGSQRGTRRNAGQNNSDRTLKQGFYAPKRGGGGGKSKEKEDKPLFEDIEREIDLLNLRIEAIGKTSAEMAGLKAKYDLLEEAKKRGLDLDAQVGDSGETLREQIDRQAASVENLTAKYEDLNARAEYFKGLQTQLQDGFINAIVEGENLSGVFENLAKSLAKAALQAALFGTGPLAGLFGQTPGKGILTGLLGFASGGYTGDGGTNEPKGIVHAGEYVFSKAATQKIGPSNLEALHSRLKGYSMGGLVGGAPLTAAGAGRGDGGGAAPMTVDMQAIIVASAAEARAEALRTMGSDAGRKLIVSTVRKAPK